MKNQIKVLLLASASSAHTIKWGNGLLSAGCDVTIFSLNSSFDMDQYSKGIRIESINIPSNVLSAKFGSIEKLVYIKALPKLKRLLAQIQPNILHAHYASSYGLLAAFAGFHPLIVSVWGGDIFTFPNKSFLNKNLINYLLKKTDRILSTSHFMAAEIEKYTSKKILVTPFGIDTEKFKPKIDQSLFNGGDIVIGTVKGLEQPYGIEYLLQAFKLIYEKYPNLPMKLLIVGGGSLELKLKKLAKELNIDKVTTFTGYIEYKNIEQYHNMLDIYLALSVMDDESFGVAILEAGACEKPVIVSDIGGLPEVVEHNYTGIVVSPRDSVQASKAIERLLFNKEERIKMGKSSRIRILEKYDFKRNLEDMVNVYSDVLLDRK